MDINRLSTSHHPSHGFISLGSVIAMAIAALFGIVTLTLGVLTHESSTVVVCLNSLRLLFEKE